MFLLCLGFQLSASALDASGQSPEPSKKPTNPIGLDRYGDPLPEGARMRFGTTRWLLRLANFHTTVFSPDGCSILTADESEIETIDAETGKERAVKLERPLPAETVNYAFSGDCRTLATVQKSTQRVCLWDVSSGKLIRKFDVPGFDSDSLLWSKDGKTMVMKEYPAEPDPRGLRVWDLVRGAEIKLTGQDGKERRPYSGKISDNSQILLGPISKQVIGVWNLRTGQMLQEVTVRSHEFVDISPDGELFACLEENSKEVRLWSVATGKEQPPIRGMGDKTVTSFGFSPNGDLMVMCGRNARFWDPKNRRVVRDVTLIDNNWWWLFSPDGKKLAFIDAVSGRPGDLNASATTLRIFDPVTGRELNPVARHGGMASELLISPDGKTLFSKGRWGGHANLWDIATGAWLQSIDVPWASCGVSTFSPDSNLVASEDASGRVRVLAVNSGKQVRQFSATGVEELRWLDSHFSRDMKTLAAIGHPVSENPPCFLLWDFESGRLLTHRPLPQGNCGSFSIDNKLLAWSVREITQDRRWGQDSLLIQDTASGRNVLTIPGRFVNRLMFSSDGRTLAGVREKNARSEPPHPGPRPRVAEICIWEVATGKERICFETNGRFDFVWSQDRRKVATPRIISYSVWSTITGKEVF
jgi:WD40 repeat protein